jgi:hypothetical protein
VIAVSRLVLSYARTIALISFALLFARPQPAHGEDSKPGEASARGADGGDAEPDDSEPVGRELPVEDPTIAQETETSPEEAPSDDSEQQQGEEKTPLRLDTDAEPTVGRLPVEDPTLDTSDAKELGSSKDEDAEVDVDDDEVTPDESDETPTEPAEKDPSDWGQPVKVMYGYQTGLLVGVNDWFYLTLAGLVQARYAVNYRTKPPNDPTTGERELQVTQGFDVARARFTMGVGLTQFVALYMRIGVVSGGDFSFQRAFMDLKWRYFRVRAGLFMNELIAEDLINPHDLLFNDYSILENVFNPGSSKGVMLTYLRKQFSINLGYSDGLRTGFSEIRSATRADFAITLRTQYAWGEKGLVGFNRLVSRRGTPLGIRLGAAIHYQDGGRSQGTAPVKIALGTLDLSARGDGWSLLMSLVSGQDGRSEVGSTVTSFEVITTGLSVMGGYFVLENLQVFGQYGLVAKPRVQGEPPPGAPGVPDPQGDLSNFQSFGVGLSYFVIPGYDNVKLSTDFQYFLGRELASNVPASPLNNIAPNDAGSQFFFRIQISAAF